MLKAFIGIVCLCLVVLAGIQIFRHVSNPSAGESADLRKLKELLQHPYRAETKITQAGNITSINTVDVHEEEIINLIVKSRQRDITPWLQQHAAQYCPKYLYFLAYRMAIQKAPIQDTLFWVFLAQMRAAADAALCKDPAAGQYLVLLNMEIVYPTLHAYAKAETLMNDPEQLKQMALLAKKQRAERRRPVITLRVSPATLEKAKATGKGYTGFMSRLLDLAINNPEMVKRCL